MYDDRIQNYDQKHHVEYVINDNPLYPTTSFTAIYHSYKHN